MKTTALALLILAMFSLAPVMHASTLPCTPTFDTCFVAENVLYDLPFLGISGDVILLEADLTTVSDVFRIFNDLVDTGGGTGLGLTAFLFSADDGPLPDPSTYSANAVAILEDPSGVTEFDGNGTIYELGVTGVPEPATFALLALGALGLVWGSRVKACRKPVGQTP